MADLIAYRNILGELNHYPGASLIAVSKTKSEEEILELYNAGHRDFGENRVQELLHKCVNLPADIRWHSIGQLQTNKVKLLLPVVHMIHAVDREKLLTKVSEEAIRSDRSIKILLQIKIAREESKAGFNFDELMDFLNKMAWKELAGVQFCGVMGMGTFTDNATIQQSEFRYLNDCFMRLKKSHFEDRPEFNQISMGMSADYRIALEEGSTMVRLGTILFGPRH